jgi:hypothetical protein
METKELREVGYDDGGTLDLVFMDGTELRVRFATTKAYNALRSSLEAVRDVVRRDVKERPDLYR